MLNPGGGSVMTGSAGLVDLCGIAEEDRAKKATTTEDRSLNILVKQRGSYLPKKKLKQFMQN